MEETFHKNKKLYNDCCDLLDDLQVDLSMKCGFKVHRDYEETITSDDIFKQTEETEPVQKLNVQSFAMQFMNYLSIAAFANVVKKIKEIFDITMPSTYKLKKKVNDVKFVSFELAKDVHEESRVHGFAQHAIREMKESEREVLEWMILDNVNDHDYDFKLGREKERPEILQMVV